MSLSPGARLGPYEVLAAAGAGGMGEVWKARDTRLDRTVAIKVLPAEFAQNAQLRLRFEREAKSISQLNHPHICTLYDVGHENGLEYLVLEYIDGETLADRLRKGPLPLEQLLRVGVQIAEALAGAHKAGIVHRDLKPGNIMLTKSGAKLLDFGLAKAAVPAVRGHSNVTPEDATVAAAAGRPLTAEGSIVGTFQYMAPEQIEGREADVRTDIFALGAVLYEMATGRRAFEGHSTASLIASILATEPQPVSAFQPASPAALDRLIRICLAKDPEARWQSAHDVALELGSISEIAPEQPARRRAVVPWAVAALLLLAIAAIVARDLTKPRVVSSPVMRFWIAPPRNGLRVGQPAVSPDGRYVALVIASPGVGTELWLRRLDSAAARLMAGTDGATFPFWSPDSRFIGFFASGKLKKAGIDGKPPETICSIAANLPRGGTWSASGVIVFAVAEGALQRVSAGGGNPVPATKLLTGEMNHRFPYFFPDGRHFLFVTRSVNGDAQEGIFVGSLDGGTPKRISNLVSNAICTPEGYLLYGQDDALRAQPFDLRRLELTGTPVVIAEGVTTGHSLNFTPVSASNTGILAYRTGILEDPELMLLDGSGKRIASFGAAANPAFSPDGMRIACERLDKDASATDIWVLDLHTGVSTRLTNGPQWNQFAVWSPDGRYVAWRRGTDVFRRAATAAGTEERIGRVAPHSRLSDWTPDGQFILGTASDGKTRSDIFVLPVNPAGPVRTIIGSPFAELWPAVSPDGRWMLFQSDESGESEVYVQRFDPSGAPQQKVQVSRGGGRQPHWSRDGQSITYRHELTELMTVTFAAGTEVRLGEPHRLFDPRSLGAFDVGPDGRIAISAVSGDGSEPAEVIVNWPELLKEKAK